MYRTTVFADGIWKMPATLRHIAEQLDADAGAAFCYGTTTIRSAEHRTLTADTLFGVDPGTVPAVRSGNHYIREAYRSGNHVWISCAMFNMARARNLRFSDKYSPQGDSIVLMQAALRGQVRFIRRVIATRTDGLVGEGIATGLVAAATDGHDQASTNGFLNYRIAFERFLHAECADNFDRGQRARMAGDIERYIVHCTSTAIVANGGSSWRSVMAEVRSAMTWIRPWSARARLLVNSARAWRARPAGSAS